VTNDGNELHNIAITINSYEQALEQYLEGTAEDVTGEFKVHIDAFLDLLPPNARILEIGSGSGRDAAYITKKGFAVQVSDRPKSFLEYLTIHGHNPIYFDVLSTDLGQKFDAIVANAVLLHFNDEQCRQALTNIYAHLVPGGFFLLRLKRGVGEEISTHKLGKPRYFNYWETSPLRNAVEALGFQVVSEHHTSDNQWLQYILKRHDL
jgi:SAM-dependent methyltransferase